MPITSEISNIEKFFNQSPSVYYKKGVCLIRAGENISSVYFIKKGYVRIYLICKMGKELTLNLLSPGAVFPVNSLFSEKPNQFFFETLTPSVFKKSTVKKTTKYIYNDASSLYNLSRTLASGINGFVPHLPLLILGNIEVKIAATLVFLAENYSNINENKNEIIIKFPITHQDIANMTGLCRESVSQEIKRLRDNNIISTKYKKIVINDINKLRNCIK